MNNHVLTGHVQNTEHAQCGLSYQMIFLIKRNFYLLYFLLKSVTFGGQSGRKEVKRKLRKQHGSFTARIDGFQWEVSRLTAENHKPKSENPELSEIIDLKSELESAEKEMVTLKEQLLSSKSRANSNFSEGS